ncbi:MAG: outer membrane beta-barrel protein [Tepidisphaeraceae bacterium]|jgi:hypothetical protein
MRVWKGFVGLAAAVVLGCSGVIVLGDDTNSNTVGGDQNPPSDQVEAPPAPAAPVAPATTSYGALMQSLEAIGIGKPMESLGFNIHGYVEGGYLYDMTVPKDQTPAKTAPGDDILFAGPYKNAFMLNQVDLTVERDMVFLPKGSFDAGFKIEAGYGRDDYFTHSDGILDQHNKQGGTGLDDQLDLLQAYVQVGIPVGTGIIIEGGKFVQLLGYEMIDPTQNLFYTHSYGFSYGRPYTMTGILGNYVFSDETNSNKLSITGGVTRGWNQSLRDNNGDPDAIMQVKETNGVFDCTANLMFGPEGVLPYGPSDYADWWIIPEIIGTWHVADQFSVSGDFLYGDAPGAGLGGVGQAVTVQWFSAAGYLKYQLDPHLSLGTRIEYYHDGRGATTGVGGGDVNYWEATVGAGLTPFPDSPWLDGLSVRPEVRCDWVDKPVLDFSKYSQVTAAIDVYFRF